MRAFVDTVETKEQAIANLESIQANWGAYRIIQCEYHFRRGCAVSCKYYSQYCSFGEYIYSQAERVHGIPVALARLEDAIFSGLSEAEAREWPMQYLSAINVGSDLSQVTDKFILRILEDEERGVIAFVQSNSAQHRKITHVIELYRRKLAGEHVKKEEWEDTGWGDETMARPAAVAVYAAESAMMLANAGSAIILAHAASTVAAMEEHCSWMRDVLLSILKDTN